MSWKPVVGKRGYLACSKHGQEWKRPGACPLCSPDDAEAVVERTEASVLAADAMRRKLPTMLDHEEEFLRLAVLGEKWAKSEKKAGRAANARNLLETAVKARTRAAEITEWREDWIRTEREAAEGRDEDRPRPPPADPATRSGMH